MLIVAVFGKKYSILLSTTRESLQHLKPKILEFSEQNVGCRMNPSKLREFINTFTVSCYLEEVEWGQVGEEAVTSNLYHHFNLSSCIVLSPASSVNELPFNWYYHLSFPNSN